MNMAFAQSRAADPYEARVLLELHAHDALIVFRQVHDDRVGLEQLTASVHADAVFEAAVVIASGPAAVAPAATLACPMVSALDLWVANAVQPAAQARPAGAISTTPSGGA